MSGDFLDSNIFIYSLDQADPRKFEVAERLIHAALKTRQAAISFQVVQEVLNVVTRKLLKTATPEDARRFLDRVLVPLWRVFPTAALYHRALDVQARFRFSFYDSLIVAAALEAGCKRLLTEDLQDGQKIDGMTVENPFKEE
jgi:predicted nucleic acid-binding protein